MILRSELRTQRDEGSKSQEKGTESTESTLLEEVIDYGWGCDIPFFLEDREPIKC